jgi:hypothetical protein
MEEILTRLMHATALSSLCRPYGEKPHVKAADQYLRMAKLSLYEHQYLKE